MLLVCTWHSHNVLKSSLFPSVTPSEVPGSIWIKPCHLSSKFIAIYHPLVIVSETKLQFPHYSRNIGSRICHSRGLRRDALHIHVTRYFFLRLKRQRCNANVVKYHVPRYARARHSVWRKWLSFGARPWVAVPRRKTYPCQNQYDI
jgi:hypothetical protein